MTRKEFIRGLSHPSKSINEYKSKGLLNFMIKKGLFI
jgi:hypothetical protein